MSEPKTGIRAPIPLRDPGRRLSLRTNYSWTLIGNVVFVLCQWGILSVLARISSPDAVGQFALGMAIATPVIMLTNMQLRQLQATDARPDYSFATYFGLRLMMSSIGYGLIVLIVFAVRYDRTTSVVILLLGLARLVDSLSDICYGLFQQREQMDYVGRSIIARGLLALLSLALVTGITGSLPGGVLAMVLVWLLIFLLYDMRHSMALLRARREFSEPYPLQGGMGQLVLMALPLGLVMMLVTMNTTIPRYFIEHELGAGPLGIFAAIAYLMVAGNMLVSAMGQALAPRLAAHYAAANMRDFRRLALRLIGSGVLLGVAGLLLALLGGEWLLALLYGPEYARLDLLLGVMLASGCWYVASCSGFVATASRRIVAQPVVLSMVVLVSLGLCWWLVPQAGLGGAVLALAGSSAVGAAGYGLLITPVLLGRGLTVDA